MSMTFGLHAIQQDASIDEFRVYDHALSSAEASAIAKAGPDALPSSGK